MSRYTNPERALTVSDVRIRAGDMGALLRSLNAGWTIWCQWTPGDYIYSTAVVDDFGNLVKVAS